MEIEIMLNAEEIKNAVESALDEGADCLSITIRAVVDKRGAATVKHVMLHGEITTEYSVKIDCID
jgi:hypothetical protein